LEFNPKSGHLECSYCGQEKLIAKKSDSVVERPYESYLTELRTQIAVLSATALEVKCAGCNAQFAFEPPTIAGHCPFCSTSIVAHHQVANPIVTPEAVLPFRIDQRTAKENVQQWLRRRWFAPTGLHKLSQQENIQGIYLPFWTYDCQTSSEYRGERGDHYTVTETYTETNSEGETETKTRDVEKTRWTSVSGQVSRFFDDILVAGTESINSKHLNAVSDWDLSNLVPYDSSYLAGFKAQRYQINLKAGFEQAKDQMTEQIHLDVEREIGGDEQRVSSVSTAYSSITFKHILLPVWVTSYRFKDHHYSVMVNARTGKVSGDRPFSPVKISLTLLAVITAIAGIFGIKAYFDNPALLPSVQIPSINLPFPNQPTPLLSPTASPPTVPGNISPSSSTVQSEEAFRQAIRLAQASTSRGQRAKTRQDWEQIANLWERAIILMIDVQPSSPNYAIAQQKAIEYQRYLNYARQQVRNRHL
jgi:ribosomal protein S27E